MNSVYPLKLTQHFLSAAIGLSRGALHQEEATTPATMTKAFATLLFSASYLPGALVLGRTLKGLGLPPDTQLVVLLATGLTPYEQALLEGVYDVVLETSMIHSQYTPQLALLGRPELRPTFSKAQLFALTQFDQVVYLDADTLPLKPLDDLLTLPIRADQVAASPDSGWPDIFNSGVLVLKPDLDVYTQLLEKTQEADCSFDGADQGLLNQVFNVGKPEGWLRLPFLYNVTPSGQYQYEPAYEFFHEEIKVVHFIGPNKPWTAPWDLGGLRDIWWGKYKEYYGDDMDVKKTIHGIDPKYYQSEPVFPNQEEEPVPIPIQTLVVEAEDEEYDEAPLPEEPQLEHHEEPQYEQEVLLNPDSYQHFYTVQQDSHQWNPAYEAPPKDGAPEAAYFPSDLHYDNQWDDRADDEPHEPDPTPAAERVWMPPPLFPWEYEHRTTEPERVFDNAGSFTFEDTWESLPLIKKIKDLQIQEEDGSVLTDEAKENHRDDDELARLKEIEVRYTGSIATAEEEVDTEIKQFEKIEETEIIQPGTQLDQELEREERFQTDTGLSEVLELLEGEDELAGPAVRW